MGPVGRRIKLVRGADYQSVAVADPRALNAGNLDNRAGRHSARALRRLRVQL
jgi:hypothetical protein